MYSSGGNEYGQCGEEPERKDDTGRPLRRDIVILQRCASKHLVRQVINSHESLITLNLIGLLFDVQTIDALFSPSYRDDFVSILYWGQFKFKYKKVAEWLAYLIHLMRIVFTK